MLLRILFFSTLMIPFFTQAQSGPGGVGNSTNNGVWLRAGDLTQPNSTPVGNWSDVSGNDNDGLQTDATKQPLFITNSAMNGQPVVRLDGTDDLVEIRDNNLLDGGSGQTFLVALRPNNLDGSAALGILGKRITFTTSTEYAYTWFFWTNNHLYADINTSNDRFNTSTTFSNGTNYLLALDYDGSQPSNQRTRIYHAGEVVRTSGESSTSIVNSNQDLVLGALNKNYHTHLSADYAEVIQYNFSLNDAQHIIVHNYLSAKYNIPLNANDVYMHDEPSNGNFDHEVAGIGRVDAANAHAHARGSGIVEVIAPSQLDDNEFLLWGHDNGPLTMAAATGLPSSINSRLGRIWRASEVNQAGTPVDVGSITMRWDLSAQPSFNISDLRLLIDTNNDGSFADETPISGATDLGSGLIAFANVTALNNNARFTLGSTQIQTLPVELTYFEATARSRQVHLNWATASEKNSAYFEVQRSTDAQTWTTIDQVTAAGNTLQTIHYNSSDEAPLTGWSYYRLRQVDLDGTTMLSAVRAVQLDAVSESLQVYPNPTTDYLFLESTISTETRVRVFDNLGKEVTHLVGTQGKASTRLRLDLRALPVGIYVVKTPTQVRQIQKR